jgi:histidine triad (HIT) family protein
MGENKMDNCVFCKIIQKEIPSEIVYEDDWMVAFDDINPQANIHTLIVPKQHIPRLDQLNSGHGDLISHLMRKIPEIARIKNIGDFRIVLNNGEQAGQEIFHLHFHLLGGEPLGKLRG